MFRQADADPKANLNDLNLQPLCQGRKARRRNCLVLLSSWLFRDRRRHAAKLHNFASHCFQACAIWKFARLPCTACLELQLMLSVRQLPRRALRPPWIALLYSHRRTITTDDHGPPSPPPKPIEGREKSSVQQGGKQKSQRDRRQRHRQSPRPIEPGNPRVAKYHSDVPDEPRSFRVKKFLSNFDDETKKGIEKYQRNRLGALKERTARARKGDAQATAWLRETALQEAGNAGVEGKSKAIVQRARDEWNKMRRKVGQSVAMRPGAGAEAAQQQGGRYTSRPARGRRKQAPEKAPKKAPEESDHDVWGASQADNSDFPMTYPTWSAAKVPTASEGNSAEERRSKFNSAIDPKRSNDVRIKFLTPKLPIKTHAVGPKLSRTWSEHGGSGQDLQPHNSVLPSEGPSEQTNVEQDWPDENPFIYPRRGDARPSGLSGASSQPSPTTSSSPQVDSMEDVIARMSQRIAVDVRAQLFKDFQSLVQPSRPASREASNQDPGAVAQDVLQKRLGGTSFDHLADEKMRSLDPIKLNRQPSGGAVDADPHVQKAQHGTARQKLAAHDLTLDERLSLPGQHGADPTMAVGEWDDTTSQISLVDELFPDIAKKRDKTPEEREVPRLELGIKNQGKNFRQVHARRMQRDYKAFEELGDDPTILLLRNASKSLVEDDFRRLIPKGKHIPEWQGKGGFLRVIPGRDKRTLDRENFYYILFASNAAAQAYQKSVAAHLYIAHQSTQTSMFSSIPPPPGHKIHGVDADEAKQAYGLLPTSQKLQLNIMVKPYGPQLREMFLMGGYHKIVKIPHKHKVLLHIEGVGQQLWEINKFVHLQGQRRGLAYALVDAEDAIVKLEQRKHRGRFKDAAVETDEDGGEGGEEEAGDGGALLVGEQEKQPTDMRWIISFASDAEAKRFARGVHGRRFPIYPKGAMVYERPGIVWAEALW